MLLPVYFLLAEAKDRSEVESDAVLKLEGGFEKEIVIWSELAASSDGSTEKNEKKASERKTQALHRLWRHKAPAAIVTIGESQYLFPEMLHMSYEIRRRWLHYVRIGDCKKEFITACFCSSALPLLKNEHDARNPLMGIISSSFFSGKKILRPYYSLQKQTYKNWRWVIIDDSERAGPRSAEGQANWEMLSKLAETDSRIHLLRYSHQSGYIGAMKATACGVAAAMGCEWLVEVDHDDIIVPELLGWIAQAGLKHPDVGFIYSDCIELFEGNEAPFAYEGDLVGFGHTAYMKQRVNHRWQNVYFSHHASTAPALARHIVGVANHVRAFRTSVYLKVGGYSPNLPVADDYELLLRMFFATASLRLVENCYLQFRNTGGSNFTFIRNQLIQDLVSYISGAYEPMIQKRSKELGWPETVNLRDLKPQWQLSKREVAPKETYWFPGIEDTIAIVLPTFNRPEMLKAAIESVLAQTYTKWRLYIVGDCCPVLNQFMEREPCVRDPRVSWWNLKKNWGAGGAMPRNYAMFTHRCKWTAFLDDDNTWTPNHLESVWTRKNQCPGVRCVVSSMRIEGKSLWFWEPKKGRVDTSCLLIDSELWHEYGNMRNRDNDNYAHDFQIVNWWATGGERFAATLEATVNYSIALNQQSYAQLANWYPDQPLLSAWAANKELWPKAWNTNPVAASSVPFQQGEEERKEKKNDKAELDPIAKLMASPASKLFESAAENNSSMSCTAVDPSKTNAAAVDLTAQSFIVNPPKARGLLKSMKSLVFS